MKLKPGIFQELAAILEPHLATEADRKTLITPVFFSYHDFFRQIVWTGSAKTFTIEIIQLCVNYGRLESGKSALIELLEAIYPQVGLDKQATINEIIINLNLVDKEKQADKQANHNGPTVPLLWNIPNRRNPNFTGRQKILDRIRKTLISGKVATLTQVISGLGGVGKTQIALEYAYRYSSEYEVIWWINAEELETLSSDYVAFARFKDLPGHDIKEKHLQIDLVRHWYSQNKNWLLIFDNAEKPEDLQSFLPRVANGHVLITSRNPFWDKVGSSLIIDSWPRKESLQFLRKRVRQKVRSSLDQLAEILGDFPLALDQAASYINETHIAIPDYLEEFTNCRQGLWKDEIPSLDYPETVATTWEVSIKRVEQETPVALGILNICAFLAPDNIPRSLIEEVPKYLSKSLSKFFKDSRTIRNGIKVLLKYSFLKANPEANIFSMHRLVQIVTRDRLNVELKKIWLSAIIEALNKIFPAQGWESRFWPQCESLLPHGKALLRHTGDVGIESDDVWQALNKMGIFLRERAEFEESESLHKKALEIIRTEAGESSLGYAETLAHLIMISRYQGQTNAETEQIARQMLEIKISYYGRKHPCVAGPLKLLALVLGDLGNFSEAEKLIRNALEIDEKRFQKDNPWVAGSLVSLARCLLDLGRLSEAEPIAHQALKIFNTTKETDSPPLGPYLLSLAIIFDALGNYHQAKELHSLALSNYESGLGENHPFVVWGLNPFMEFLLKQEELTEAELLARRALRINEEHFGMDSSPVAFSLYRLAEIYKAQAQFSEAELFALRAIKILENNICSDNYSPKNLLKKLEKLLGEIKTKNKKNAKQSVN